MRIKILNFDNEEARIEYPTPWIYKVIGADFQQVKIAVAEVLENTEYTIEESNVSSKGAYISVKVEVLVENEDIRDSIFFDLKQHSHVKMVL